MKGLLIKDFRQLLIQKNAFAIFAGLGIFFLFFYSNVYFAIAYTVFMFANFGIAVISYDQVDNGMMFLMTLPINRKQYVLEKYIFVLSIAGITGIIYTMLTLIVSMFRDRAQDGKEIFFVGVTMIFVAFVFLAFMLPIHLKYGAERARSVMFLIAGLIVAAVYLVSMAGKKLNVDFEQTADQFFSIDIKILGIIGIIFSMMTIVISYLISVKIMEKKEF